MKNIVALCVLLSMTATASAFGQESKATDIDTLRLQLTVSRYDGDKRVASVPLSLSVVTSGQVSRVTMGTEVPVSNTAAAGPVGNFSYKSVGTSAIASASRLGESRYQLSVKVDATWVSEASGKGTASLPQFGNFNAEQQAVMSDGGSMQFTSAADAATGQVVRVDATVTKQR